MLPGRFAGTLVCLLLGAACGPQPDNGNAQASGGTGGTSSTRTKAPDGTSCAPAPADASGAAAAWQRFLDWHDANAVVCGNTETWPSYECWIRAADPRSVVAFTDCMMSDGCSSISNEDACVANPQNPGAGYQLNVAAQDWFQNVCIPKSVQCGFSNDNCGVFAPTLRPELRCAIVDCVEGSCANFAACMKAVNDRFLVCSK